jgi:HSP20 family molecular chaperone IbpA
VKTLPLDKDFDEFLGISDFFDSKFLRRLQLQLDEMVEEVRSGKIKGTWEIKQLNEPGMKGYYIQGRFGTDESLEPLEPLKPIRRRPLPENPFEIPKSSEEETREPLTDVFEEDDATKIYVELPGEEEDNIHLNVNEDSVEIKAENFYKIVRLPKRRIEAENISSEYKNGVLKITLLKKKELRWKDKGKTKMV